MSHPLAPADLGLMVCANRRSPWYPECRWTSTIRYADGESQPVCSWCGRGAVGPSLTGIATTTPLWAGT